MAEPATLAERSYYWSATALALLSCVATGLVIWKMYLTEADRVAMGERLRRALRPLIGLVELRRSQAHLTWETLLVIEALDDYALGDDLERALSLA